MRSSGKAQSCSAQQKRVGVRSALTYIEAVMVLESNGHGVKVMVMVLESDSHGVRA
jgi:hypothetical protein